jgi:hypothetical protein
MAESEGEKKTARNAPGTVVRVMYDISLSQVSVFV